MGFEVAGASPSWKFERQFHSLAELEKRGYVTYGTIAVPVNPEGKVLLLQEKQTRKGEAKEGKWSLVFETGKQGESVKETFLAGVAEELGIPSLMQMKLVADSVFAFDFRRYPEDKPARVLVAMMLLPRGFTPHPQGAEVADTRWVEVEEILGKTYALRANVGEVVRKYDERNMFASPSQSLSDTHGIRLPSELAINPERYLELRNLRQDLYWK